MANKITKIVIIGAGSLCFGPEIKAFFQSEDFRGSTLVLVDLDREKLDKMAQLARLFSEHTGLGIRIEQTADYLEALSGAEFVINSTTIKRNELWKKDFSVPKKYGIRQTLGENGGPGSLGFTLRTLPLVFDIVHAMERLCPDAYFINFSNPESRIICAIGKYSKIRSVGLCHGIYGTKWLVAKILGLDEDDIEVRGAGINHFQWLLKIYDRRTGEDLYPLLAEKEKCMDLLFDENERPVAPLQRGLFKTFGLWPTCGDGHTGEYLPYGWEGSEGTHGYNFDADEKDRISYAHWLDEAIKSVANAASWLVDPAGEKHAEVISGIMYDRRRLIDSGVVYNKQSSGLLIPNLPAECAVEVPIMPDQNGVDPQSLGPLPDACAWRLEPAVRNQQMSVEAAVHASKELALQALFLDPVIDSMDAARKILDELWEINRPYIRTCV